MSRGFGDLGVLGWFFFLGFQLESALQFQVLLGRYFFLVWGFYLGGSLFLFLIGVLGVIVREFYGSGFGQSQCFWDIGDRWILIRQIQRSVLRGGGVRQFQEGFLEEEMLQICFIKVVGIFQEGLGGWGGDGIQVEGLV